MAATADLDIVESFLRLLASVHQSHRNASNANMCWLTGLASSETDNIKFDPFISTEFELTFEAGHYLQQPCQQHKVRVVFVLLFLNGIHIKQTFMLWG